MKEEDSVTGKQRRDDIKTKAALDKEMVQCCRKNFDQTLLLDDVTTMEEI
jgi:hypothetical protein